MATCRKTPNTMPPGNASPSSKAASRSWRRSSRAVEVIDPSSLSGEHVKFGAHVWLVDEETEKEATYQIVGVHEADIKAARLSISSPLAKALIGKKVGDIDFGAGARAATVRTRSLGIKFL